MRWIVLAALCACAGVQQRLPDDVLASVAHDPMHRLETERFIIYYPAPRRAEVERFLGRAERCADLLRDQAVLHEGAWDDKMVIVMPDVAFNNAFVLPELAGYEPISVIPLHATLDFTTEFGLPPDPGFISCHELVHYVHEQQIAGFWRRIDQVLGHIYTPQLGYDPWFFEGLATHYEAALSPGVGRPSWPIFTGMFAAGYAGHHVGGGDLSSLNRLADVGHHYLVGSMFVKFLTERYGERPLWVTIADQADAFTGWFFTGTFATGFGVSFGQLLDEFDAWVARTYPVRPRPAGQRALGVIGNNARYARGRDGTEAWVAEEVDLPPHLVVRDGRGELLARLSLVEVVPPRTLVQADPLLVSGLSVTGDGREVWLTVIDLGATFQVPRLLRWRRGETRVTEVASGLGPGGSIDPAGATYYYCAVDGDRWSLAAYDVRTHARRTVLDMAPGTYALGAQVSPDGTRVVVNVWDGVAFAAWVVDTATGAIVQRIEEAGRPVWDASFTSDGRVMWLGVVAGRFQIFIDGVAVSDAPYAVLNAREAGGTIRFLDREGWDWELAEIALPARAAEPALAVVESPPPVALAPPSASVRIEADTPYSVLDHLFYPQQRAPGLLVPDSGAAMFGLVLGGGDRLELQRWSVAGYVQPKLSGATAHTHYGAAAAYLNMMLAPVQILAEASALDWADPIATMDPKVTLAEERRTRDASLTIARTWRGSLTASLSGIYTDDFDQLAPDPSLHRRVGGPSAALQWVSGEATRYTGFRRALLVSASSAYYPRQLSTFTGDITDVGGSLATILPLPIGRRHTLRASVRGRALLAHDDTGLLQIGGDGGLGTVWNRSNQAMPPTFDTTRFAPNLRFVEPLRGYEDYAITTDRAALWDLSWRYPIIVDRGVAATAWVLPASFLRELDLGLFAAGAIDREANRHAAAGGTVSLRLQLLRIPLIVTYQLARRLVDDRALTQLVAISPDL